MKILILSEANSVHTIKWVKSLTSRGIYVGLWSITAPKAGIYDGVENLVVEHAGLESSRSNYFQKIKYLFSIFSIFSFFKKFRPDIVHAHYASSYGLIGSFLNFRPFVISVWGSDVYDFPRKNSLNRKILKRNLSKADYIFSTSKIMAVETSKYTNKQISVTPFGIDLDVFSAYKGTVNKDARQPFIIGTIKSLEKIYGIEYLIDAFSIFKSKYPNDPVELHIVGGGSQEAFLKELALKRGIGQYCVFVGPVSYADVPKYHRLMDLTVYLSLMESFGVSAIEASASEKPVIVSNVGGLPEVVEDRITGIVVQARSPIDAANAIEKIYLDMEFRNFLGRNGRKRVEELYDWKKNVSHMVDLYADILKNYAQLF